MYIYVYKYFYFKENILEGFRVKNSFRHLSHVILSLCFGHRSAVVMEPQYGHLYPNVLHLLFWHFNMSVKDIDLSTASKTRAKVPNGEACIRHDSDWSEYDSNTPILHLGQMDTSSEPYDKFCYF
jgi:hypothetical protein